MERSPGLPHHWSGLRSNFYRGKQEVIELVPEIDSGMIKGFIFDLDGVITDTGRIQLSGLEQLADDEGWQFDRAANEQYGVCRDANRCWRLIGTRAANYSESQLEDIHDAAKMSIICALFKESAPAIYPRCARACCLNYAAGLQDGAASAAKTRAGLALSRHRKSL